MPSQSSTGYDQCGLCAIIALGTGRIGLEKETQTDTCFEICIDPAHPALSGHFPGNPIVPGALLLAEAGARLSAVGSVVTGLRKVRFVQPVRPAEVVEVECYSDDHEQLRFKCRVGDTVVARGIFVMAGDADHD